MFKKKRVRRTACGVVLSAGYQFFFYLPGGGCC